MPPSSGAAAQRPAAKTAGGSGKNPLSAGPAGFTKAAGRCSVL